MFNGASITEVCFSFSPGCCSQIGSVGRVCGHLQGLVSGINRAQNPIFDRFPVAPLLLSPKHRKSHEIFSIEESSGPFLLVPYLCLYAAENTPAAQMHTCLVPSGQRFAICVNRYKEKVDHEFGLLTLS